MRTTIEVSTREEGDQLRAALDDPTVRTFVRVMGLLVALPSNTARERVLRFADECLSDQPQPLTLVTEATALRSAPAE